MKLHAVLASEVSLAKRRLQDSLLAEFGDRMVSLRTAAKLTGINIMQIETAVLFGELRVAHFGPKSRRILLSELHEWWKKHLPEKMAPI